MTRQRTIIVNDVGPCGTLVIPVQPGGTILSGFCGVGKSLTLEAIALGLGGRDKGRVAPREGTKRGSVDCLGVVLNVSAGRVTRNGESEVASIEEFDIGSLIDPPVKEEEARNRYGIKSLLRMTKVEADPSLFYHLAGGKEQFEAIISPDALKSADLVEMAGKIRRAFDAEKRRVLSQVETEETAAAANRNAGDGLDLKAECDGAKVQELHSAAVSHHAKLQEQWDAAEEAQAAAETARAKLAKATGSSKSIAECEAELEEKREAWKATQDRVKEIEAELRIAKAEAMAAYEAMESATSQLDSARQAAAATAGWQEAIDRSLSIHGPKASEVIAARTAVETTRKAIETAAVVRAARERIANAVQHQERAAELRKEAERLKDAAQDTDSVLSAAVASERFAVKRDVLIGVLPDGTAKPYYDLSAGEKTMIAIAEKIDRVRLTANDPKQLCIVDLPQENYQDLPDSVRNRLFAYAAEHNVAIVTAQVSDDAKLSCVVWKPRKDV